MKYTVKIVEWISEIAKNRNMLKKSFIFLILFHKTNVLFTKHISYDQPN